MLASLVSVFGKIYPHLYILQPTSILDYIQSCTYLKTSLLH